VLSWDCTLGGCSRQLLFVKLLFLSTHTHVTLQAIHHACMSLLVLALPLVCLSRHQYPDFTSLSWQCRTNGFLVLSEAVACICLYYKHLV
jgi:hypothetical protein